MHRSGSSCLTGSLQAAGLYLGEVFTHNPYNTKGNRESAKVTNLNTALLRYNGGDWDQPPTCLHWNDEHRMARDAIVEEMVNSGRSPWGFKDPRSTFTLPFWQEIIPTPQLVASFRHPAAVAASLSARNGFSVELSLKLWTTYNRRLLDYMEESEFPIVCFDVPKKQYLNDIKRVSRVLGLQPETAKTPFFDLGLRSQSATWMSSTDLPEDTLEVYADLMSLYNRQLATGEQR